MARKFKVLIPTTNGSEVSVMFWEGCRVEQFAIENGYDILSMDKAKLAWNLAKIENGKSAFDRITRDMVFDSRRTVRIKRNVPEVVTTLKACEGKVTKSTLHLLKDKLERSQKTSEKNQLKLHGHIHQIAKGEVIVPSRDNPVNGLTHPTDSTPALSEEELKAKAAFDAEQLAAML